MNKHIKKAIDQVGSQTNLAHSLGVTPVFVNQMLHGVKQVPARLCINIENLSQRNVTRYQLRPDVFGKSN